MTGIFVIRTLSILIIIAIASNICAEPIQYIIIFNDDTEGTYFILNNDAVSRRIKIKNATNGIEFWMSTYRIRAIIESESQIEVTNQFISETVYYRGEIKQSHNLNEQDDKNSGFKTAAIIIGAVAAIGLIAVMQNSHGHYH